MKRIIALTLVAAAIIAAPHAAFAACAATLSILDGLGASKTTCTTTDGSTGIVPSLGVLGGANNANKLVVNSDGSVSGQVTDGTTIAAVKASGASAATTNPALVVAQSPNPAPACTGVLAINQTSSTDLRTFTNFGYICTIMLVSAAAQNLSLIEGTGSTCATGTTALIGGTAASLALAANGGFSVPAAAPWLKTQVTADHLCLLQSGAGNVSGIITFVDHA